VKKYRGAIIGFGKVAAEAHVPGFRLAHRFEIVAAVDPVEERRVQALAALPGARAYADFASAARGEARLDFVDVATPPHVHAAAVLEALAHGCHALCEKPLALDLAEIGALRRAARRGGRSVFVVHNWKYAPLLRRLHGLLRAGTIGQASEIDWQVLRPSPPAGAAETGWRLDRAQAGGGILMDHGWHAFYLMCFLAGREPKSMVARLGFDLGLGVENAAACEIEFEGLRARIELRWGAPHRRTGGVVRGTLGTISIEDDRLVVAAAGRAQETSCFSPALSASSYHPEWFPALLEAFRGEIEHPSLRGRNLAEAVRVGEMIAAAYRSDGRTIPLELTAVGGS